MRRWSGWRPRRRRVERADLSLLQRDGGPPLAARTAVAGGARHPAAGADGARRHLSRRGGGRRLCRARPLRDSGRGLRGGAGAHSLCRGTARGRLWPQILADVVGVSVETLPLREATSFGAALCALVGAGVYAILRRQWRRRARNQECSSRTPPTTQSTMRASGAGER